MMQVIEYDEAETFLNDYEELLLEREAASQMVFYLARYVGNGTEAANVSFGVVQSEAEVILLFCNIVPHNMIVYTVDRERSASAANILADYFGDNPVRINGIIADLEICRGFVEQYKQYSSIDFIEVAGINIMELRNLNELKLAEGHFRQAHLLENKLAAEWMIAFQMETLISEMDYEAARIKAEKQIEEGHIYLYEDMEGRVVSMAIAERRLVHGTAITYVYTPEEYRGMGYAASNIYCLSQELLKQGNEFCTLFVNKKNSVTMKNYEKVGYIVIGEFYEYKILS